MVSGGGALGGDKVKRGSPVKGVCALRAEPLRAPLAPRARWETAGLWAGHLLGVKWREVQALFSPRHAKDRARDES